MTGQKPGIDKKTFNLIAGGVGVLALAVLLFGVLDIRLPSLPSFTPHEEPVVQGPLYPIHDEATFKDLSKPYHIVPPQAQNLAFDINLPPEWTNENEAAPANTDYSKRIISEVARLRGPYINIYRPQLLVQSVALKHDITAQAWLHNHILASSYILQGDVVAISNRQARAAFTYTNEAELMYVDSAVHFTGNEAVFVRYEVPLALKDMMSFVQKRSIESFKLATEDETMVEAQKPFTLAELVKFAYPESWQTAPPDLRDIERINIQVYNKNDANVYQGYMHIFVVKRRAETNFESESARLRDFVGNTMKLDITDIESTGKPVNNPRFTFQRKEVYAVNSTAQANAAPQELSLVALGNNDIYIFILSLSPNMSRDMYNWGRNQRALDLITQSIQ